jgi:hypothetical protein
MKSGINLLDTYTIRARLVPAILAAMPALALIAAIVPWKELSFSHALGSLGLVAVLWLFSDRARRKGKEIEPLLFTKMGGMPSTAMLRHSDRTFDADTKKRLHGFLAAKLKEPAPSAEQEAEDPKKADAYYERAGTWLREHTRDTKKFNVLFDENMTYGARRNQLGLKGYALGLNIAVVILCVATMLLGVPLPVEGSINARMSFVLVVALIHAAAILVFVNEEGAMQAARLYGRQLLFSCEALAAEPKPPTPRPAKAKA